METALWRLNRPIPEAHRPGALLWRPEQFFQNSLSDDHAGIARVIGGGRWRSGESRLRHAVPLSSKRQIIHRGGTHLTSAMVAYGQRKRNHQTPMSEVIRLAAWQISLPHCVLVVEGMGCWFGSTGRSLLRWA